MKRIILGLLFISVLRTPQSHAQSQIEPKLFFEFNKTIESENYKFEGEGYSFTKGIDRQALSIEASENFNCLRLNEVSLDGSNDFSVQFWIQTTSKKPTVLLSQKDFKSKGISAQKNVGWVLYSSGGTFAWNVGSGSRRVTYERDNGGLFSINDGLWHQITITYNKAQSEFRLYYDGINKAIYKVGFEFSNNQPLMIGSAKSTFDYDKEYLLEIASGAKQLQVFVDAFNEIGLEPLKNEKLVDLISNTQEVFDQKIAMAGTVKDNYTREAFEKALVVREKLLSNPYTVYQIEELTLLKPVSKLYFLQNGRVLVNDSAARFFTEKERLFPSDFSLDNLSIWDKVISPEDIRDGFTKYRGIEPLDKSENQKKLTVGVWNIWHGGVHWSLEKDGWDSRLRICEMIRQKNADIVLMQETYSSGDFIAAELGYYFATTSDYDYRAQGSNISVLSRYPIKELEVPEKSEFNNVAVKVELSETQEIYAMSNWYGMNSFSDVYDFHKQKFDGADEVPVLFGGDFNAVPNTDGGKNPASVKLQQDGFTDAYRSLYPDVQKYPGATHRGGNRIDQLYYKGKGLNLKSTEVIGSWPGGFPSDHFMILSEFELD